MINDSQKYLLRQRCECSLGSDIRSIKDSPEGTVFHCFGTLPSADLRDVDTLDVLYCDPTKSIETQNLGREVMCLIPE